MSVLCGGQTPVEIAWGHKTDDIVQIENMNPQQPTNEGREQFLLDRQVEDLARQASQEARQR
eukprot:6850026-Karenia_brevis.AAC.1